MPRTESDVPKPEHPPKGGSGVSPGNKPYIPKGFRNEDMKKIGENFAATIAKTTERIKEILEENVMEDFTVQDGLELIRKRFTADDIDKLRSVNLWPIPNLVETRSRAQEVLAEKQEEVNRLVAEYMAGLIDLDAVHHGAYQELGDLDSMTIQKVKTMVTNKIRDAKLKQVDFDKIGTRERTINTFINKYKDGGLDRSQLADHLRPIFYEIMPEFKSNELITEICDGHISHLEIDEGKLVHQNLDLELADLVEQLNYNRGSAIYYIARNGNVLMSSVIQDLEKAKGHVERELIRIEDSGLDYYGTADAESVAEKLGYYRGTAVSLISHAGTVGKETIKPDLKRAITAIDQEIKRIQKLEENS